MKLNTEAARLAAALAHVRGYDHPLSTRARRIKLAIRRRQAEWDALTIIAGFLGAVSVAIGGTVPGIYILAATVVIAIAGVIDSVAHRRRLNAGRA